MATLVMLSGGLDSAAALVWALRNLDEPVHAHHVHLRKYGYRFHCETVAVERIVGHLRARERRFDYSESRCDLSEVYWQGDEIPLMWAAAAVLTHRPALVRLVLGWCREDGPWDGAWAATFVALEHILAARARRPPEVSLPFANQPKWRIMEFLGRETTALTWGCRDPVFDGGFRECGRCHTCLQLAAARRGEEIMPAEVRAYEVP